MGGYLLSSIDAARPRALAYIFPKIDSRPLHTPTIPLPSNVPPHDTTYEHTIDFTTHYLVYGVWGFNTCVALLYIHHVLSAI
jgi:hypothetical protein